MSYRGKNTKSKALPLSSSFNTLIVKLSLLSEGSGRGSLLHVNLVSSFLVISHFRPQLPRFCEGPLVTPPHASSRLYFRL